MPERELKEVITAFKDHFGDLGGEIAVKKLILGEENNPEILKTLSFYLPLATQVPIHVFVQSARLAARTVGVSA